MPDDPPIQRVDTDTYHRYDAQVAFDIDDKASLEVGAIPAVYPIPLENLIQTWLTAMLKQDADRLWDENIGDWDTFCHIAERCLEDVLPLNDQPFRDCHCPNAVIENTAGYFEQNRNESTTWLEAAAGWLQEWLNLFNRCYQAQIVDDLEDLAEVLDNTSENPYLDDAAVSTYVESRLTDTPTDTPTEQPSQVFDISEAE
jgi:hypothetical protein